jgi:hypothetical protein
MLKKLGLPALLVAAALTLSPAAALARDHGEGGRGYAHGQSFSGRSYSGGRDYGRHDYGERRGDHDRDRYYRGGGFGFGLYSAPYAYQRGCGYYDRWGYWHPTPCAYPGY